MRTLVTGATGFVGRHLLELLDDPVIVTRNGNEARQRLGNRTAVVEWNPIERPFPTDCLRDNPPAAIINLMGESVADGRWTRSKKERIRTSRVEGTKNLIRGLTQLPVAPTVLVNASAVGYFGDGGESELTETSPGGVGFLAGVCREWEESASLIAERGTRVVTVRIGLVLGPDGGALQKLLPIFRYCLGGRLGTGQQWMPWIHVRDLARLFVWCRDSEFVCGPVNASAPAPVRNSEFTRALAGAVGRPALLPVPKFAARLALGEFASSLFHSQRMVPARALDGGFEFEFATLSSALREIVG